ncbi:MAG: carboxypeptidase regulatory-like domain-containing protein, partial [Deltaproteobacteria bacterium]|nr:carboxypeptidase regulatory-like domain-containing protein [Deltaproteobacteria bacterium]
DTVTTTTNTEGAYSFTGLSNGTYQVTASHSNYLFKPISTSVTVNGSNMVADFSGKSSSATTNAISGTVTSGSTALAGATINLTGDNTGSVTTDSDGKYTFTGLIAGNYNVIPSLAGYLFSPISTAVTVDGSDITADFTATASAAATHTISGTVTSGSTALAGVKISLTGDNTGSVFTGEDGTYAFTGLADGDYTVTPSHSHYIFDPVSTPVTISGSNMVADFEATASYIISGTVASGGTALAGVTINLTGDNTGSVTTGSDGIYAFTGLAAGSYTVTPSLSGYSFSPTDISIPTLSADTADQNFIATAVE